LVKAKRQNLKARSSKRTPKPIDQKTPDGETKPKIALTGKLIIIPIGIKKVRIDLKGSL
jgi:hypothetical protein